MRIVNAGGRLGLVTPGGLVDVESSSGGRFAADVQAVYDRWVEFRQWAPHANGEARAPSAESLEAPVPRPRQVFAAGLNYREHAREAGLEIPSVAPLVFTKFPSSVTGPHATVTLPSGSVDFEAELVVVLGLDTYRVSERNAWGHVAGLTVGQDLSERAWQTQASPPQLDLGKSMPGFAPLGPELVTPDEFADPDDLEIGCLLNGEQMQKARTDDLIFPVVKIIEILSSFVPLYPGDVIFTGTPSGTGWARDPKRMLQPGDELVTYVEGIGSMHNRFTV